MPEEKRDTDELADAHTMPLDNEEDAQWLSPTDPRRVEIERKKRDAETGMDSVA